MEPLVLGDKVRCRAGGPSMVIGAINNVLIAGQHPNGPLPPQVMCVCYWWNDMTSAFNQWQFPMGALERID